MRGAVQPLPGFHRVAVEPGNVHVAVEFDPARLSVERILAALKASGESAHRAD